VSPAFESFLARLYVDSDERRRFLAAPGRVAAAAGLTGEEIAAAVAIDRVGLELAAASFERKRHHRRRFRFGRWRTSISSLVPWITRLAGSGVLEPPTRRQP
jgi:hypothetical protein